MAAVALASGCGGDDSEDDVATLPSSVDAPGNEDELAFCLGRLVDPALTDPGRFDLVSECTGLDRDAVEGHPSFVACLSGLARSTRNDRVQEHLNRCLVIFRDVELEDGSPGAPE